MADWIWDEVQPSMCKKSNSLPLVSVQEQTFNTSVVFLLKYVANKTLLCRYFIGKYKKCNWGKNEVDPDPAILNQLCNDLQIKWINIDSVQNMEQNWQLFQHCLQNLPAKELTKVFEYLQKNAQCK